MDKAKKQQIANFLLSYGIYIVFALMILVIVILDPSVLSLNSLTTILTQSSTRCMLALGVAGLIVLAGTDLSIGRMVGMGAVLAASLLQVSGSVVAKLKMHAFIATLGMQLVMYGVCSTYYNWIGGSPIGSLNEDFKSIAQGKVIDFGGGANLSLLVVYAGIAIAVIWFIWNKTTFGKNMFAVGGNTEAAAVSGVNVDKTIISTYILAGILYGIASVLELGRTGSATNNLGVNYETDAISACVVGGVSFNGGVGTIGGVVLGVLLLQAINFGLAYVDVDPNLQYIVKGLIILVAVAIDMRKYVKKK